MKDEQTKLILYFIFSVLFIIATTNYLDDVDLINQFGQKDIEQYYIIAKEAPKLPFNNIDTYQLHYIIFVLTFSAIQQYSQQIKHL